MKKITPKPNTFYVKKSIEDDIGVIPAYADAYVGLSTTYDIKSNPDTSFYLVESDTVKPNDFVYGEGSISEMYLNIYVNSLKQSNPQTANWLDVFSVRPNIDIVEGNMSIASGNTSIYGGAPLLLYNTHNVDKNTFHEDFDGSNKSFLDLPIVPKKILGVKNSNVLYMTVFQLRTIAYQTDYVAKANPDKHSGWGSANIVEEVKQFGNWIGYGLGNIHSRVVEPLGEAWRWATAVDDNYENREWSVTLYKQPDGNYKVDMDTFREYAPTYLNSGYAKRLELISKPRSWWLAKGAREDPNLVVSTRGMGAYDQFEENYIDRCTQLNSIFSNVYCSPDVRDIKDQTLEGPGDTDRFISYSYANLVNAESPSDNSCLRMKAFWENYAGDYTGTQAIDTANPFGRFGGVLYNDGVFNQTIHASIIGIPQPTPIDVTTSGTGRPAYAPEIEVVMKINEMANATFVSSGTTAAGGGSGFASGSGAPGLDRSFSIVFNDDSPTEEGNESLYTASKYWQPQSPAASSIYSNRFSPWILFLNEDPDSGEVNVYTNANKIGRSMEKTMYLSDDVLTLDTIYKTTVPMGEWFTMRIKLNMYTNSGTYKAGSPATTNLNVSGGGSLVYFPDLLDDNGQARYASLAHGSPWGENSWNIDGSGGTAGQFSYSGNNAHYPNMTFWLNNMRAINQVPGSDNQSHINNKFTKIDDIPSDDKTVDILIDSISFRNWGPTTTNATICTENGMGMMTKLPAGNFMTPTIYPGGNDTVVSGTVSVYPTGTTDAPPDNYYTKSSAITASYISLGFETNGLASTSSHEKILMSNFSTGQEETADPITMVSGGFFTATNYKGTFGVDYQNDWFNNLTVGDSTQQVQITGGAGSVDNFTQKGTIGIKGTEDAGMTGWVRTGNPIIAAKILRRGDDKSSIVVDQPELFDIPLNTPLAIELNNTDYDRKKVGKGSIGYYDTLNAGNFYKDKPLVQTRKREGNVIFLSREIEYCDAKFDTTDNSGGYGVFNFLWSPTRNANYSSGGVNSYWATSYNLAKATISPYKYWVNLAVLNASSSAAWGDSFADTTHSGTKLLQTRVYDGLVGVSGGSTFGTTFNESLYNDGIYANKWDIKFGDPANTIIDLNTDFGYGSINSTNNPDAVPDSDGGLGRMGRDSVSVGDNYINLGSYVYTKKPNLNTPFNFIVKPTYMNMFDSLYACNINTKDAASNKAKMIYGITDPLPNVDDFSVSPSINVEGIDDPTQIFNLTKSNATDLVFNWKEDGDDINYRMLWVDTDLIENKYHSAVCIIPLNESVNTSPPKFYTSPSNYVSDTSVTMDGSNMTPDIEGACGYGQKFDGTLVLGASSSTGTKRLNLGGHTDWTHVFHLKPSDNGTFFAASGNNSGKVINYKYEINSGKVKMTVGTSGATAATLESDTTYGLDGKQPLAVVLTWNKELKNNNFKLYVNGKLEDTADRTSDLSMDGANFACIIGGNIDSTNKYTGFIEEIVFHSKCAYIPQNVNKYTLKTGQLPDMSGGKVNKYQARLFLFDYHNIRGTSKTEVCTSNTASWKATGVT